MILSDLPDGILQIAVLVAIAIPIFTTQLEKSREATDIANVRSAYADVMAEYITKGEGVSMSVTAQQGQDGWQGESGVLMTQIDGKEGTVPFSAKTKGQSYIVAITATSGQSAKVTIE